MNFGIIGYGNIGQLIATNLVDIGFLEENQLYVSNRTFSKLKNLDSKIKLCKSNEELVKKSDKVFISVETPDFLKVLDEIIPFIDDNFHIIHSSAGIDFKDIAKIYEGPVSCVIPSIASSVCNNNKKTGVSIFYHNNFVSSEEIIYIETLFSKFSNTVTVDNFNDLKILTIATSCMPALVSLSVSMFAEKLEKECNLTSYELNTLLNETIGSTLNILDEQVMNNNQLINKVATKKGITEKGLNHLKSKLAVLYDDLINILQ